jgi:2-polyprenyl-3-methyl-5-hydroxy-6-metoxy-1,4-benzoquinol methylase
MLFETELPEPAASTFKTTPRPDCPLCSGPGDLLYDCLRDRFFDAPGIWSIRHCRDRHCGLVWIDPIVDIANFEALYTRYYTHEESDRPADLLRRIQRVMVGIYAKQRVGTASPGLSLVASALGIVHPAGTAELHHAVLHLPRTKPGQRLLDVGTGSAKHLPRLVRLGLKVEGIEPDNAAVQAARLRGLNVTVGDFMTHPYEPSLFDFVTMSHVIEHVHEPLEAFHKAFEVLAPGGRLVVLTPNVASRGHRRFGRHWSMLDAPRHLTLFDQQTMAILARKAGLEVQELRSTVCYAREVFVISSRLAAESEHQPSLILGVKDSLRGIPYQLGERFRLQGDGEELLLVARKPLSG